MSWDWNRWPARAMDDIQRMFIEMLIDSIRYEESHDRRPVSLHLGEGFSRFWRIRRQRDGERSFSHSNIGEIDSVYGLSLVHDRFVDRVQTEADGGSFHSEIRLVTESGGGSERMVMTGHNDPSRLSYSVDFRGPASGARRARRFSYQYIRSGQVEDREMRMMPTAQAEDVAMAMQSPAAQAQKKAPREMSEMRIAWLT